MSTIVTRSGKGSPLTHTEVDNNFTNLNTDKYQSGNNASFGTLSASGAFSANGGATLGDASGDALTINSSAVSIPNGLNFDSNTLVIDATNNNVGIGTSSPSGRLTIVSAATQATIGLYNTATSPSAGFSALRLGDASGTNKWQVQYNNSDSSLNFYDFTAATNRVTIDSSGNLGIGTTANASAILDAQSTTKGVRMPNMTTTQKNAIASPAAGLMVFDTTLAKLCVYSGSAWQTITSV